MWTIPQPPSDEPLELIFAPPSRGRGFRTIELAIASSEMSRLASCESLPKPPGRSA